MKFVHSLPAICFVACYLASGTIVLAASNDATQAEMNPVVVTATRTKHSLGEVSAAVSVVTRKELDKIPAQNVLDVLRTMPGVTVDSDRSSFGSSTYNKVIIRGMGGNTQGRVLVLVDGMPAMPAGTNIFEWNSINLDSVERIEVVRGPASALYGSRACRHKFLQYKAMQRAWTIAKKEDARLAYLVATARHCFKYKNVFSMKWRTLYNCLSYCF